MMKLKTLIVALLLMLLMVAPATTGATARPLGPQASLSAQSPIGYQIVAVHSGKCLEIGGLSVADGGIA
jgi:hypothetical protein